MRKYRESEAVSPVVAVVLVILITVAVSTAIYFALFGTLNTSGPLVGQQSATASISDTGCVNVNLHTDGADLNQYELGIRIDSRDKYARISMPINDTRLTSYEGDDIFQSEQPYGGLIVEGGKWSANDEVVVCLKQSLVEDSDSVEVSLIDAGRDTTVQTIAAKMEPSDEKDDWEYATLVFKQKFDLYSGYQDRVADKPIRIPIPPSQCMNDDFSDIRFTQVTEDGEERLDYYIEEDSETGETYAWVEVADLPAGEPASIQMYYGQEGSGTCAETEPVPEYDSSNPPSSNTGDTSSPEPIDSGENRLASPPDGANNDDSEQVRVAASGTQKSGASTTGSSSGTTGSSSGTSNTGESSVGRTSQSERFAGDVRQDTVIQHAHLAGYWEMNEDEGAVRATDYVGYNHGTIDGVTTGSVGILGSEGYQFDGEGLVDFTNREYHLDESTFLVWVKPTGEGTQTLFEFENGVALTAEADAGELVFETADATVRTPYEADEWQLVAVTADDKELALFIDGEREATVQTTEALGIRSGFVLGDDYAKSGTTPWQGGVDELAIYVSPMSDTEIAEIYAASVENTFYTEWREYPFEIDESTLFIHDIDAELNDQETEITVQSDADPSNGQVSQESQSISVTESTQRVDVEGITQNSYRYRLKVDMRTTDVTKTPVFYQASLSARNLGDRDLYAPGELLSSYEQPTYETVPVEASSTPLSASVDDTSRSVYTGQETLFDAGESTGDGLRYRWDFVGDGVTDAVGQTATHTYEQGGVYNASLTIEDSAGNTDTQTFTVAVEESSVRVDAGDDQRVAIEESTRFEATLAGYYGDSEALEYHWRFSDGQEQTGRTIDRSFETPGTYTVDLTVTDGEDVLPTDSLSVDAFRPTESELATSTLSKSDVLTDETYRVAATIQNPSAYEETITTELYRNGEIVDTDTLSIAAGSSKETAFETSQADVGEYQYQLKLVESDSISDIGTVAVHHPMTAEAGSEIGVPVGDEFTVSGSGSTHDAGAITEYEWQFEDGPTKYGESVSYAYDEQGAYTVTLTVTDETGDTQSDTTTVRVADPELVVSNGNELNSALSIASAGDVILLQSGSYSSHTVNADGVFIIGSGANSQLNDLVVNGDNVYLENIHTSGFVDVRGNGVTFDAYQMIRSQGNAGRSLFIVEGSGFQMRDSHIENTDTYSSSSSTRHVLEVGGGTTDVVIENTNLFNSRSSGASSALRLYDTEITLDTVHLDTPNKAFYHSGATDVTLRETRVTRGSLRMTDFLEDGDRVTVNSNTITIEGKLRYPYARSRTGTTLAANNLDIQSDGTALNTKTISGDGVTLTDVRLPNSVTVNGDDVRFVDVSASSFLYLRGHDASLESFTMKRSQGNSGEALMQIYGDRTEITNSHIENTDDYSGSSATRHTLELGDGAADTQIQDTFIGSSRHAGSSSPLNIVSTDRVELTRVTLQSENDALRYRNTGDIHPVDVQVQKGNVALSEFLLEGDTIKTTSNSIQLVGKITAPYDRSQLGSTISTPDVTISGNGERFSQLNLNARGLTIEGISITGSLTIAYDDTTLRDVSVADTLSVNGDNARLIDVSNNGFVNVNGKNATFDGFHLERSQGNAGRSLFIVDAGGMTMRNSHVENTDTYSSSSSTRHTFELTSNADGAVIQDTNLFNSRASGASSALRVYDAETTLDNVHLDTPNNAFRYSNANSLTLKNLKITRGSLNVVPFIRNGDEVVAESGSIELVGKLTAPHARHRLQGTISEHDVTIRGDGNNAFNSLTITGARAQIDGLYVRSSMTISGGDATVNQLRVSDTLRVRGANAEMNNVRSDGFVRVPGDSVTFTNFYLKRSQGNAGDPLFRVSGDEFTIQDSYLENTDTYSSSSSTRHVLLLESGIQDATIQSSTILNSRGSGSSTSLRVESGVTGILTADNCLNSVNPEVRSSSSSFVQESYSTSC